MSNKVHQLSLDNSCWYFAVTLKERTVIFENTTELIMYNNYMELGAYKQDHFFWWGMREFSSVIKLPVYQH